MDLVEIRDRIFRRVPHIDVEDVDDEINLVQRVHIQPVAKQQASAEYVTQENDETVPLVDIAKDIYTVTFIEKGGHQLPILKAQAVGSKSGARIYGDNVFLQGVPANTRLVLYYDRRLSDLGTGEDEVLEPEISKEWHDLYWLGSLAAIEPERYHATFYDRLRAFIKHRNTDSRVHGGRVKLGKW